MNSTTFRCRNWTSEWSPFQRLPCTCVQSMENVSYGNLTLELPNMTYVFWIAVLRVWEDCSEHVHQFILHSGFSEHVCYLPICFRQKIRCSHFPSFLFFLPAPLLHAPPPSPSPFLSLSPHHMHALPLFLTLLCPPFTRPIPYLLTFLSSPFTFSATFHCLSNTAKMACILMPSIYLSTWVRVCVCLNFCRSLLNLSVYYQNEHTYKLIYE